ncbi:MAG: hypothetical protein JJT99_02390 [Rhodobacteraceae bacterium]|nr:hypothetical protein [Paracoccaceae bacterium]
MSSELMIYAFMAVTLIAGGLIGYLLMSQRRKRALTAVAVGHGVALVGLLVGTGFGGPQQALGYAILLSVFVVPACLGLAAGSGLGWWRGRGG